MPTSRSTQLKTRTTSEVLDTAFQLARANWSELFQQLFWVLLPFVMIRMYSDIMATGTIAWLELLPIRPDTLGLGIDFLILGLSPYFFGQLYGNAFLVLLCAQLLLLYVMLRAVARIYLHGTGAFRRPRHGGPLDFLALLPAGLAALPLCMLAAYIAHLLGLVIGLLAVPAGDEIPILAVGENMFAKRAALLVFLLLLVLAASRFQLSGLAALHEECGMLASLRRSWRLTRRAFWQTTLITLAVALLIGVLVALPPALAVVLFAHVRLGAVANVIDGAANILAQGLLAALIPLLACVLTVHYYNLRVRHEAFDLTVQLEQAERAELQTLYEHGLERYQQKDWTGALAAFEQVIHRDPQHRGALYYRIAIKQREDLPAALADANHALSLFPNDPAAFATRGYVRYKAGDRAGARLDYDEALRRRPDDRQTLVNSIALRFDCGELEPALQELEYLLKLAPNHDWALYNSACIYARWGRDETGLERLAAAIDFDDRWRATAQTDPDFASLVADPRFVALVTESRDSLAEPPLGPRSDGAVL